MQIVHAGGVQPLVMMLGSASEAAQTHSAAALSHLAAITDNKRAITVAGGIERLVRLLSEGCVEAQRHAAAALWQLASSADYKNAIAKAGGIPPLVAVLRDEAAQESAAAVLSELARSQKDNRAKIVRAGGIEPLVAALTSGSAGAKKHSACALWGMGSTEEYASRSRLTCDLGECYL